MAASIVPKSRSLLSALLFVITAVMAGSVAPSNATLPTSESNAMNQLRISGGALVEVRSFAIAPLMGGAGRGSGPTGAATVIYSGNAVLTDYATTGNLTNRDVAIISCDPNGSNIDPSTVVGTAGSMKPVAIILYSLIASQCDLTNSDYQFGSMFTITTQADANNLVNTITRGSTNTLSAAIGTNATTTTTTPSTTANEGGPAPTTAVAMSILYSITGIITLMFLVIIATGAVRAHRHPERYGPRVGFAGRPRQSRAKGLARAMLETLPIVKFGDPEPAKTAQDVELEDGHGHTRDASIISGATAETVKPKTNAAATVVESGMGAAQADSVHSGDEAAAKDGELGCSICTEDFTAGEDVRVLPCNHKYHPACIDPWLLNVSGTCPLCRHDLRPITSLTEHPEGTGEDGDGLPPPLSINEGADGHQTPPEHRMTRFQYLRTLREAPANVRIAGLRAFREETRLDGRTPDSEEPSRRARLTGRLREAFHIRTRTENPASSSNTAPGAAPSSSA